MLSGALTPYPTPATTHHYIHAYAHYPYSPPYLAPITTLSYIH